tara:strand:+ start:569 stop:739 length:171 start_codon:yes stop_codon:yes gene_type:complete
MSDDWTTKAVNDKFRNKKSYRKGILQSIAQKLMAVANGKEEHKTEFGNYENVKVEE